MATTAGLVRKQRGPEAPSRTALGGWAGCVVRHIANYGLLRNADLPSLITAHLLHQSFKIKGRKEKKNTTSFLQVGKY